MVATEPQYMDIVFPNLSGLNFSSDIQKLKRRLNV